MFGCPGTSYECPTHCGLSLSLCKICKCRPIHRDVNLCSNVQVCAQNIIVALKDKKVSIILQPPTGKGVVMIQWKQVVDKFI